jgi:hypothetical protein
VLAHPPDLGEEHRVGVPPALEHVRGTLHDGRRVGLGQRDGRRHRPRAVHPLDEHHEAAVVDDRDGKRLAELESPGAGIIGKGPCFGEGQRHRLSCSAAHKSCIERRHEGWLGQPMTGDKADQRPERAPAEL